MLEYIDKILLFVIIYTIIVTILLAISWYFFGKYNTLHYAFPIISLGYYLLYILLRFVIKTTKRLIEFVKYVPEKIAYIVSWPWKYRRERLLIEIYHIYPDDDCYDQWTIDIPLDKRLKKIGYLKSRLREFGWYKNKISLSKLYNIIAYTIELKWSIYDLKTAYNVALSYNKCQPSTHIVDEIDAIIR